MVVLNSYGLGSQCSVPGRPKNSFPSVCLCVLAAKLREIQSVYKELKQLVKPEEIGGPLLYLVSPGAGFVTGESIAVDGGLLCRV